MDRAKEMIVAEALNQAIWLRDNAHSLDNEQLIKHVSELGSYSLFSARQLSAIINGLLSHHVITKLISKTDKTGGNLNAGSLEILRNILYSRADDNTDYKLIASAVSMGTSQGMVSKLTGVPQGSISKKIRSSK
jgi:hypothetical protein